MRPLRERLRETDRIKAPGPTRAEDLRARLDRIVGPGRVFPASQVPPRTGKDSLDRFVAGRRVAAPSGQVFVTEWTAPPHHRHGATPLGELARLHEGASGRLFPEFLGRVSSPEQVAFLDTETTGLAGGAGTIPFLVGVGRWSPDRGGFRVTQLFLEDLDRERALLEVLAQELEGVLCLVTYNGRAFDVPLLENRHVLNRVPWPLSGAAHLDLLHPARTLWRHGQPDCRLATLERSVLGYARDGDIPGWEIPAIYYQYLRGRKAEALRPVFRHNRDDILSLSGLVWAAAGAAPVGVGLLHARRGRHSEARPALEAGLQGDLPTPLRWRALRELSLALKREGEWGRALEVWAEGRALAPSDLFAVEEAAKVLEHRLGQPGQALDVVEQALASGPWAPRDREALEKRRVRLRAKTRA